jgi:copper chaperone CopZ
MMCASCVGHITKALQAKNLHFQVSLKDKTVSIEGGDAEVEAAVEALDDVGYEAERKEPQG